MNMGGISVLKRCLQLFDNQYEKKLDRKADLVIDKENKTKKNFDKFSLRKKLRIIDGDKKTGLSRD